MTRLFIVFFIGILFNACSSKEPKVALKDFPHYDKNKANIYITNKADGPTFIEAANGDTRYINFAYKIINEDKIFSSTNCYGQYSYIALEEGFSQIELGGVDFQLWGKRDDHHYIGRNFKKGEVYFFRIAGQSDEKTTAKQIFSLSGLPVGLDVKLSLFEISKEEALKYLNNGLNFQKNRMPQRAEDNPVDEDCKRWY